MANFLLKKIVPIKDYFLGVNPFEGLKDISSAGGLKEALRHLSGKEGRWGCFLQERYLLTRPTRIRLKIKRGAVLC